MFTVAHLGYADTLGIFRDVTSSFTYDMDTQELSDVQVSIQSDIMNSFHAGRDRLVKSKDFLNVSAHPQITFVADGGTPTSDTSGQVTGFLTILGQTMTFTLDVQLNKAAVYPFGHKRFVLGLSIDATLDRSTYGMTYGVNNGLVGDTVAVRIETETETMQRD
ncbi:polyisoprenoid-binding protein YceI [Yoonia sediminilitoris]|uniref:Polyisoprenoid-binding protein YceI n=2 Tax=Yoonia sediminilitoris TaxID=1286148 RepID=A0A2T6KRR3_9RHOB|nr:polyisoprenoid-binding protein YceI [Yoonia sediminilitoris]RCW99411.1 polyisoprenoid-binding protein YceI [Yoonia sediminilitoris]